MTSTTTQDSIMTQPASPLSSTTSSTSTLGGIQTYIHTQPRTMILPLLRTFLPSALPVIRRLQLHYFSQDAVVIATFPSSLSTPASAPSTTTSASTVTYPVEGLSDAESDALGPLAVILLDRSRAPETEAWIFASSETEVHVPADLARTVRKQLLALLAHTAQVPVPSTYPSNADPNSMKLGAVAASTLAILQGWEGGDVSALEKRWTGGVGVVRTAYEQAKADANADGDTNGTGKDRAHEDSQDTKNTKNADEEEDQPRSDMRSAPSGKRAGGVIHSYTLPYVTFLVPPEVMNGYTRSLTDPTLPPPKCGLVWDHVRDTDHQLVISRTTIPRTPRTLALMPSVCLRTAPSSHLEGTETESGTVNGAGTEKGVREAWHPDTAHTTYATMPGRPVGWAFLSPDGSLATLHVEEDYRGQGLGQVLAKRALGLLGPSASDSERSREDSKPDQHQHQHPASVSFPQYNEPSILHDQTAGFPLHTTPSEAWGYAHVARANAASVGVLRAVGGRAAGECFWVVADVARAADAVASNATAGVDDSR